MRYFIFRGDLTNGDDSPEEGIVTVAPSIDLVGVDDIAGVVFSNIIGKVSEGKFEMELPAADGYLPEFTLGVELRLNSGYTRVFNVAPLPEGQIMEYRTVVPVSTPLDPPSEVEYSTLVLDARVGAEAAQTAAEAARDLAETYATNPITGASVDGGYHLILLLADGTPFDAGYVRGPQGVQGDKGDKGDKGDTGAAVNLGNVTGAIDLKTYTLGSQVFRLTATGNLTLAAADMPTVPAGMVGSFSVRITQDATGGRTLTLGGILKPFGSQPSLSSAPNAIDLVHFLYDGVSWQSYIGGLALA